MKLTDKREIREEFYYYIDIDSFCGNIVEIQKYLKELPTLIKEHYQDNPYMLNQLKSYIKYDLNITHNDFDGWDITIWGIRLETDDEVIKRVKQHANQVKAQKIAIANKKKNELEKEKELYEKLKKKFE